MRRIRPVWGIWAGKNTAYYTLAHLIPHLSVISSLNTEVRSKAAKGRLTETLIPRRLPINNRPLNILLIVKCEVCEATKERTNISIGRVSLCVFHQTVSRNICLLASRNDDTVRY